MQVTVPDIGDFSDVPVIEVLVGPGDEVQPEDPLVVLESDKATMEVPSPAAGKVAAIEIKVGDTVSEGSVLMTLETSDDGAKPAEPAPPRPPSESDVRSRSPCSAVARAVTRRRSGPPTWACRWR